MILRLLVALIMLSAVVHADADLGMLDPAARPDTRFGPHYVLALDVSLLGISEVELCKTYPIDKATADLDKALAKGQPVPIVIGDGKDSATAHYVLITQMEPGPPNVALVARMLSPLKPSAPVPATVVMIPVAIVTLRTRLLFPSPK